MSITEIEEKVGCDKVFTLSEACPPLLAVSDLSLAALSRLSCCTGAKQLEFSTCKAANGESSTAATQEFLNFGISASVHTHHE